MVDNMAKQNEKRTFDVPNASELDWIESCLRKAKEIAGDADGLMDLPDMDEAWGRWLDSHDPEVEDPNPVINAFGIAFGQHIIDDLGLNWAVVSDEHGTEMCVHGQPGDVLVYPCNFVSKRYVSRQKDFFVAIYSEMRNDILRMQRMCAPAVKKPWWKLW
jgi:hypothetical protein